ncbi:Asp-tRNA(Asn)/Glu-tRNA(Gln) amidotransferase A subunit family amidase [Rhizobium sp. BK077]|uniref:amidase n=1 Tax=unclassified Rhizobium TaxID=2613769 RepID=UPI00160DF37F|nr:MULTISPECIES: amidase [unclassified Rhizobium]MBB3302212.1 Asp-tRNA(Asn)/Glu-tRNA(Gln) amidotransferase A subunit family amidase [Rhizobium sp. BK112]MBB3371334.1 Asp-tRNA(Asn)/Glu-tRNA(Gln) amidotransferase A subunit family amidase [Rhizobium sp. BK077]MBB4182178.1 Asp-tRNA(Asn)/Glu-tRNA(Gln) amidotransferase A subunit family amidase [Rhizobium sp. BK109]MBB4255607.1 Asp-tRNA(Asn)/Glu-tRNA(Gln) amidotransferase A subunit family amidase [Rhizobium sp. BK008]
MNTPLSSMATASVALSRRDVSFEELTSQFLARITESNSVIGAVRFVTAMEALDTARTLDRRLEAGGPLPPLAGMPVVIKENCDTTGIPCSAGLPFRAGYIPTSDAPVVKRVRDAGAIILGVSVSDPGAFGVRTVEVTHPRDPALTVGGSSGGSAAALAAGYCLGAIGTDTGGSVRIPSACCGTVGLKPSFGAWSKDGVYPLVPSLDHIGPMATTVEDVRLMWNALSERGTKIGYVRSVGFDRRWISDADCVIADDFAAVLDRLARTGTTVREIQLPHLDEILEMHGRIFFVEGAAYHRAHFGKDISNYPIMAQEWFEAAGRMQVGSYISACEQRTFFTRSIDHILDDVDLILTPTLSVLHPRKDAAKLCVSGEELDFTLALVRQTCLFNHTGHPALTMPMKKQSAMPPPSLQIVGRRGYEATMLDFATSLEQRLI